MLFFLQSLTNPSTLSSLSALNPIANAQLTDYIPDAIEPMVMPVFETIANYPYLFLGSVTSALATGTLFWQNHVRSHYLAISSGFRNNCGLHCITHTWFSLPENQFRSLFETHPIFSMWMREFYEYYNLPGEPNLDNFIKLNKMLSHPLEREMMWGPVLRRHLFIHLASNPEEYGNEAQNEIIGNTFIAEDRLSLLTKQMGATFIVHDTATQQYNKDIPSQKKSSYEPIGHSSWKIEVFNNGVHYDFKLPTYHQNIAHNCAREKEISLLQTAARYDLDEYEQDQEISRTIRNSMQLIQLSQGIGETVRRQEQFLR